ncbi:glycosyltransferase, partial [Candidatus Woesearchaeota archaeon]|nr:glycosyltransferase [Candidatus Woesearchaeota archaeon]
MKVAFYLDVYTGGSGRVVETFLDNFDKNIDKLIILNNPVKEFKSENTKFIILKKFRNLLINLIYRVFKINNILRKNKVDVLCSMLTVPNITSIMATKFLPSKTKCIINEHTFLSEDIKLKYKSNSFLNSIEKFSLKSLIKFFYRSSDKIVVISNGMKSDLIKNYNIDDDKVEVIYTPIHVNKIKEYSLKQPKHEWFKKYKIILGVGRLSPEKRFQDLISAFSIVKKKLGDVKLIIIGKGGEKERLTNLINKLKLNKDIEII